MGVTGIGYHDRLLTQDGVRRSGNASCSERNPMRILKTLPLIAGLLAPVLLVRHFGLESLTGALTRVTWWQFALVCAISGATMVLDTLGWRYTLVTGRPPFLRLPAPRCAGQ